MRHYDILITGPVSLDRNIDCDGMERREVGGAVVASCYAAVNSGAAAAVFTKFNPDDISPETLFSGIPADLYWKPSHETTGICNRYFTRDRERRSCTALSRCDPFLAEEFPEIQADVSYFAGLMSGDFSGELFRRFSGRGKVAVDVQCLLRCAEKDGSMVLRDWAEKREYLPAVDFLKTDAAEAQILTGLEDRRKAAQLLNFWGAKEVMITHSTEVILYDGADFFAFPLRPRNLSGRTGRGDTCFAAYLAERRHSPPAAALLYASALVSLKMEEPGPFRKSRSDVEACLRERYPEYL